MNLALYLIVAGLVLLGAVVLFVRNRQQIDLHPPAQPPVPVNLTGATDAILLATGYGRITYANQFARDWFGLNVGDPNLELLAEQVNPPDVFRDLFAAEGRATMQVGKRRVDAASHILPGESPRSMVVIMRDMAASPSEYGPSTTRALVALSEVGQIIADNNPLPETLTAILESITTAIPHGAAQIYLLDEAGEVLTIAAQRGDRQFLQTMEQSAAQASSGSGFTGWVMTYKETLIVEDCSNTAHVPEAEFKGKPFGSYLGTPLTINSEFVGVLQLVDAELKAFNYEDLALLEAIANSTATAIDKTQQFEEKLARISELSGIQSIVEASAGIDDRTQLISLITKHITEAIDVQMCGLLLFDPVSNKLEPARPFQGIPETMLDVLNFDIAADTVTHRVWLRDEGWYANNLRDETLIHEVGLSDYVDVLGLRSMALMPLVIGKRRIGMVQVNNRRNGEGFGPKELQQLHMFANQSAIILDGVNLVERDARRAVEVRTLQDIGMMINRAEQAEKVFFEASKQFASLLGAEMAGLLHYDEGRQNLFADSSFAGVEREVQQYIQVSVAEGSELEKHWRGAEYWICNDIESDPVALESGLDQLSSFVGINQILLVPLVVNGVTNGAVLVANKQGHLGFGADDARLANIFAAQAALSLANTRLQSEIQVQISESRALRRISEIVSRPVSLTDIVQGTAEETTAFFSADAVVVAMLDEASGDLMIMPAYTYGIALEDVLSVEAYGLGAEPVAVSGRPFFSNNVATDLQIYPAYRPFIQQFDLQQMMITPLEAAGQKLGELMLFNTTQRDRDTFTDRDLEILSLIAMQLSAAIERIRLAGMTDESLRSRVAELDALGRISNEMAVTVELDRIADVIRQEVQRVIGDAYCTILMLAPREAWADLDQPEVMRRYGEDDQLTDAPLPIEQAAIDGADTVLVDNYTDVALPAAPPSAVSALAVPVLYGAKVVGVIHLYQPSGQIFDERSETFVRSLALKASTAYGSAASFREQISRNQLLSRRVEQMNQIFELGQMLRAGNEIDDILDAVANAVLVAAGYSVVLVNLYDAEAEGFRRVAQAGVTLAEFEEMRKSIVPRAAVDGLIQEEYRLSESYFLPAEKSADWEGGLNAHFHYHEDYVESDERFGNRWHPDDALIVPMRDSHGELIGYISVDAPSDGQRPVRSTLEPLEIFAQQAAIGIENFQLLDAVQREVATVLQERDVLERLYAVTTEIQRADDVSARLQVVARGIRDAGWGQVYITLRDATMDATTLIAEGYDGEGQQQPRVLSGEEWRERLSDPEFYEMRIGTTFYLRYDHPWVVEHIHGGEAPSEPVDAENWHPADQLFLPIYGAENRVIGVIGMQQPVSGLVPTESGVRPIELFANQAANAIEMTRLYQETSRAADQESTFNELMQAVTSSLEITEIVRSVADGLQTFLPFTHLTMGVLAEAADVFSSYHASFLNVDSLQVDAGDPIPVDATAFGHAVEAEAGSIYRLGDGKEEFAFSDISQWYEARERTAMIVPMMVGGSAVGALKLGSELSQAFGFDDTTMALVQRVANLAAVSVENARLYQQTAERERFSASLARMSSELNASLDLPVTLESICRESLEILGVEGAYIWQAEGGKEIVGIAGVGPSSDEFIGMHMPMAESKVIAARVAAERTPLFLNNLQDDADRDAIVPGVVNPQAAMAVPLLREGYALGSLLLLRVESTIPFTYSDMERAAVFGIQASIAMENARLYQEMRDLQGYTGAIVESIQQGIVVLDRDGVITTFNDSMRALYGWEFDAEGASLFEYQPEYADVLRESLDGLLTDGEPRVAFNVPGQTADQRDIIQNFYLYPLQQDYDLTGVVLLVEDVTERSRLEAALQTRADQMAALTNVSSRLTAMLEPEQVVSAVLDQLGEVVTYDGVSLWLRDGDNLQIAAARGYDNASDELVGLDVAIEDSALFRDMAEHQVALNVTDVRKDDRFPGGEHRPTLSWLGAPLVSKGEIIGLLTLDKIEAEFYTENDSQLVLAFANQAAVALENARLFSDARKRTLDLTQQTARMNLLNRVSMQLAQSLDLENIFEVALKETIQALDVPYGRAVIFSTDDPTASVLMEHPRGDAPPDEVLVLDEHPALAHVRRTMRPFISENAQSDSILESIREDLIEREIASVILVPMLVGGQAIGALTFECLGRPRSFTSEQLDLSLTIASQAAIAAQNANLLEQSFLRTRELETLFEASQVTAMTLDLDEVIESVAEQMQHALGADATGVMLWDEVEQELVVYAESNMMRDTEKLVPVGTRYDLNDYLVRNSCLEDRRVFIAHHPDEEGNAEEQADMARVGAVTRMFVPLVVRENAIGLVKADYWNSFRSFGLSEQRIARTLAGQAAIAIENARLNTETAAQVQEAFLINDLSRAVSAAVDMSDLLPVVRNQVPSLTEAEWLYLVIYDKQTDMLSFPVAIFKGKDLEMPDVPLGDDEFSWIIRNRRPLILVGEELAGVRSNLSIKTSVPDVASFLGVPLAVGSETVGVLAVGDEMPVNTFGLNDQRILSTVAGQLAVAVQNTNLFAEMRRFNQELESRVRERTEEVRSERDRLNVLYNITAELSATLDMDRVLERALDLLAGAVGANEGLILLIDHTEDRLYKRAELGYKVAPEQELGLSTREGLAGWVIQNRQSVVIDDVQKDPRWMHGSEKQEAHHSTLAVLLETSDDPQGVLMLYSPEVGIFNEDHLRLVSASAAQLATSINNAELYLFIRRQAERLGDMVREQQVETSKNAAILEGVADGVMFADEAGEITLFNEAAERVLEVPRSNVLGRPITSLTGLYSGGGGRRWADTIARWTNAPADIRSGDYMSETLELEGKIINVTLAPVHLNEQLLGTVSVFRDVTREVEVDRMKTDFISNVSHELRTPMTSIKGYADLLAMGAAGDITDRQREFLDTIKANADRLSDLVNDILNISRFDSGREMLDIQKIGLDIISRDVLANIRGRSEAEGKSLTFDVQIANDLPPTYSDPAKVTQIITNLLDNAYHYTPDGGTVSLKVELNGKRDFLIAVSDTGIGIPQEDHEKVFDRFYRNDEHPMVIATPGTGLGLTLVKQMVELHNGKIWFESEEGKGSTFYVTLPYLKDAPTQESFQA